MDSINDCVKKYLSDVGGGDVGDHGWTIMGAGDSTAAVVAGRGIVATRDYRVGEVIFVDGPLIVSPRVIAPSRTTAVADPVCPVCYASAAVDQSVRECPGGCGLPVCSQRCADRSEHEAECRYVRQLRPRAAGTWSVGVYNAVAPIRGKLALKDGPYERFRDVLQKKSGNGPVFEVEELKKNINMNLEKEDEQIMITTCKIMDANCFETIMSRNDKLISLKGLYPVAAFMNHCCVPNTMHNFNEKLQMIVKASLPIHKGQEITTTYTNSIWPTSLRQNHLLSSKQFLCTCTRCCDPEEFGTELAALNCIVKNCNGRIIPLNPLDKTSIWHCKTCTKLVSNVETELLNKNIEFLTKRINVFCPKSLETVLKTFNIHINSSFVVDLRLKFIWKSKNNSLNLEQLLYKEKSCVEMLNLVQKLGLGQCRLIGLISLELLKVIKEKVDRFRWNVKTLIMFKEQMVSLKNASSEIFDGDANTNINICSSVAST